MNDRTGANARDVLREIERLGGVIENCRRTGEVKVSHPSMNGSVRIQHPRRRKSATRTLTRFLSHIERNREGRRGVALRHIIWVLAIAMALVAVATSPVLAQAAEAVQTPTIAPQTGDELLRSTIGQVQDATAAKYESFDDYWKASESAAKGKAFEAVVADLDNRRLAAMGDARRVLVTADNGQVHDPADLKVVRNGEIVDEIQCKFGKGAAIEALDDPKYARMKILTTDEAIQSIEEDLRRARLSGEPLPPKQQGIADAIESGRLMKSTVSGAPLPEGPVVVQTAKRVVKAQFEEAKMRLAAKVPKMTAEMSAETTPKTTAKTTAKLAKSTKVLKGAAKGAGPLAVGAEVAIAGVAVYDTETAYAAGEITQEERVEQHVDTGATAGGAAAGAWVCAKGGAAAGAAVGAVGGPVGAAAGAALGAVGGAIGGAIAGSWLGGQVADWFASWW